ncbi:MAG: (Na+)-NQR maturation NqrM [Gammaproteobacteria bacterium]|nr:(Na+)-NQR maturation NqrM [Gammaproteobacteria bacterium]
MLLFVVSAAVMLTVILLMSIGVLFGRRAISGSCGGLNQAGGCALCSGDCPERNTTPNTPEE